MSSDANTQRITLKRSNEQLRSASNVGSAVVHSGGPQGPPGASALPPGGENGQVLGKLGAGTQWLSVGTSEEIDTKIATHSQQEVVHLNATSGRDFAALFENGLV